MKIGSDLGINRIMNETEPGIGAWMARGWNNLILDGNWDESVNIYKMKLSIFSVKAFISHIYIS